jgi:predicted PurR-regulated permease PerM
LTNGQEDRESRRVIEIQLPWRTIFRILVAAALAWALFTLWPELLLLAFALLFAVALTPVVTRLERLHLPRWLAVALIALGVLGAIASFATFILPPLVAELAELIEQLPALHDKVVAQLPHSKFLRKVVDQAFALPNSPELARPLEIGQTALSAAVTVVLVIVLSLYLLIDGRRLYAWLLAYVPRAHRARVAETVVGVAALTQAWVRGQLAISALFALFVGISLSVLEVEAVLPLALLAFVCDVIPVVGIIIATVPAALLALADSPLKALAVVVLFNGYHMFETYVLVPKVYGTAMRLSTLTVLLALLAGASLYGVAGALLILPLVAAYPIVERIWLKSYLSPEVLHDHQALAHDDGRIRDAAVDKVIRGQRHTLEPRDDRHLPAR